MTLNGPQRVPMTSPRVAFENRGSFHWNVSVMYENRADGIDSVQVSVAVGVRFFVSDVLFPHVGF